MKRPGPKGGIDLPPELQGSDVYFEFIPVGRYVKVCAVHAKSGVEVSIAGPASRSADELKRTALAKLSYVMRTGKGGLR